MKKITIPFLVTAVIIILMFLAFGDIEQYFTDLLNKASSQKLTYTLVSFLALTSDIVLPVPSSIVMYTNGFVLGLIQGAALSLASVMLGAYIGYYLGKYTSLGLKAKQDQKADLLLSKYGAIAILVSRGIPILSETICVVCGYNKIPLKQYLVFNLIGYIPLCLLYAFCGSVGYDRNTFLLSFGFSLLISAAFWFFGKSLFLKSKNTNTF